MKSYSSMTVAQAMALTGKYIDCDYFLCADGVVGVYTPNGVVKLSR